MLWPKLKTLSRGRPSNSNGSQRSRKDRALRFAGARRRLPTVEVDPAVTLIWPARSGDTCRAVGFVISESQCCSFDEVGLPGFQFIQDPIEYETRTHHNNMDLYERIQEADLKQMAVIVATFAYQAANADQLLPRKPLPKH